MKSCMDTLMMVCESPLWKGRLLPVMSHMSVNVPQGSSRTDWHKSNPNYRVSSRKAIGTNFTIVGSCTYSIDTFYHMYFNTHQKPRVCVDYSDFMLCVGRWGSAPSSISLSWKYKNLLLVDSTVNRGSAGLTACRESFHFTEFFTIWSTSRNILLSQVFFSCAVFFLRSPITYGLFVCMGACLCCLAPPIGSRAARLPRV